MRLEGGHAGTQGRYPGLSSFETISLKIFREIPQDEERR